MKYHWDVRVTRSQAGRCNVFARKFGFEVESPLSFDAEHESLTSLEYFLGALATDLCVGFNIRARTRRVEIVNLEARLKCELDNPLRFLDVVGETGSPAIKRIGGQLYIESPAEASEIQATWEKTLQLSPLYQTLKSAVIFDVGLKVI